jgi:hypothetical protein
MKNLVHFAHKRVTGRGQGANVDSVSEQSYQSYNRTAKLVDNFEE